MTLDGVAALAATSRNGAERRTALPQAVAEAKGRSDIPQISRPSG